MIAAAGVACGKYTANLIVNGFTKVRSLLGLPLCNKYQLKQILRSFNQLIAMPGNRKQQHIHRIEIACWGQSSRALRADLAQQRYA
jgi:hypothetical protein